MSEPIRIERENYTVNTYNNKIIVSVRCPKCARFLQLENSIIADNGDVMPTMFCEYNCGFRNDIKLVGWRDIK